MLTVSHLPLTQKATADSPLQVNVYTADADDNTTSVKKGEVTKIQLNPPPKVKK